MDSHFARRSSRAPVSHLQEVTFSINPDLVVTSDVMRVFCPASDVTLQSPSTCNVFVEDLFSKPMLLQSAAAATAQVQHRCACASFLAIHMDIITERLTQVIPMRQGQGQLYCIGLSSSTTCESVAETSMQHLAQSAFSFASAFVKGDFEDANGVRNISETVSPLSCFQRTSDVGCWCSTGIDSSSCPWERLVSSHVLQGMMNEGSLPLSLAAALDEV